MEITKIEITAIENVMPCEKEDAIKLVTDLELTMAGGGMGDIVLV